jgi:hypothetical protein
VEAAVGDARRIVAFDARDVLVWRDPFDTIVHVCLLMPRSFGA